MTSKKAYTLFDFECQKKLTTIKINNQPVQLKKTLSDELNKQTSTRNGSILSSEETRDHLHNYYTVTALIYSSTK